MIKLRSIPGDEPTAAHPLVARRDHRRSADSGRAAATVELARRLRTATSISEARQCRNQIVEKNLGLVGLVLRRLRQPTSQSTDAWSEGACALIECAARYDPERQIGFASFAIPRIRGRVLSWLLTQSTITGKIELGRKIAKLRQTERKLPVGTLPTQESLAGQSGMPLVHVKRLTPFLRRPLSLDCCAALALPANTPDPRDAGTLNERLGELRAALLRLPPRLQQVVADVYGLDGGDARRHREIASDLKLTRARIGQLQREALRQLRHEMKS